MSLTTQFYTMLAMITMGSFFGASLDTYNRFLKRGARKRWIVFVNDILFWIVQGLIIFYILFLVNFGEIRFYIFVALVCGFAAYQALMRNIYIKTLETMINIVISVSEFLFHLVNMLIYSPIKWLILMTITLIFGIGKGLYALVKMVLKVLLLLVKILLKPIYWIIAIFLGFIPTKVKNTIEKYYKVFAGNVKKGTNKCINGLKYLVNIIKRKS